MSTSAPELAQQNHDDVKLEKADSTASYGATGGEGDGSRRSSVRKAGSVSFIRRTGSTSTTDQTFERQFSKVSSGKSLTSVRTRLTSVSRHEYHEDLKPDLSKGLNINLIFTTFIIAFGSSFQFGYNIGVLNNPKGLIVDFYKSVYTERHGDVSEGTLTFLWSLTNAIFIPGGMAGAFLGGWLADKVGRKKGILLSNIPALLGAFISVACVAAKAPEMLMIGRVFFGLNSGFANCLAPMYLTEIAPYNLRGAFGTVHQLAVTIGIFLGSVFGLSSILGTADNWPYLMLFEALPAATSLCVLPWLPESPRYLLLIKRDREGATDAVKFYRRTEDVATDIEEMDTEDTAGGAAEANPEPQKSTTIKDLFITPELRRPLLIACLLQVVQQFSGINAIFFYSNTIFKDANVPTDQIQYAIIGTNAVNVFMTVIAVPLMDIAGRRLLLLVPMAIMIVDLVFLAISQIYVNADGFEWLAYISIICVIIYVIGFAVGLGPIPMMIGAELFRQGPRPAAMTVASCVNWITTFVVALGFEPLAGVTGEYTFLIFLFLMIGFLAFTYFFVPETKNKTFEEIAHQFAPGGELEVEEVEDEEDDDDDNVFGLPNADGDQEDHSLVTFTARKHSDSEAQV